MMENGHPGSLPWLASFQMYSDLNTIYNYKKKCSKLLNIYATNNKSNEKTSFKNIAESYWDRKILGQLSCKRGNFRENLGKYFGRMGEYEWGPLNNQFHEKY